MVGDGWTAETELVGLATDKAEQALTLTPMPSMATNRHTLLTTMVITASLDRSAQDYPLVGRDPVLWDCRIPIYTSTWSDQCIFPKVSISCHISTEFV